MNSSSIFEYELGVAKSRLLVAVAAERSERWCMTLWSRFIRFRDGARCLNCGSAEHLQAHHIFRKSVHPIGRFELGNGISLCWKCHRFLHAKFNGKPLADELLNARGGDDQDEMAFLYGLLAEDAESRGLEHDEYYFISDESLDFFSQWQGYDEFVRISCSSRLMKAHVIWRNMPEAAWSQLANDAGCILLSAESWFLHC